MNRIGKWIEPREMVASEDRAQRNRRFFVGVLHNKGKRSPRRSPTLIGKALQANRAESVTVCFSLSPELVVVGPKERTVAAYLLYTLA